MCGCAHDGFLRTLTKPDGRSSNEDRLTDAARRSSPSRHFGYVRAINLSHVWQVTVPFSTAHKIDMSQCDVSKHTHPL